MAALTDMTLHVDIDMPGGFGVRVWLASRLVCLARWLGGQPITMRLSEPRVMPMRWFEVNERVRLYLDGVNVTRDAFRAYGPVAEGVEARGRIWLYKRNVEGAFYLKTPGDANTIATEICQGMVRWESAA